MTNNARNFLKNKLLGILRCAFLAGVFIFSVGVNASNVITQTQYLSSPFITNKINELEGQKQALIKEKDNAESELAKHKKTYDDNNGRFSSFNSDKRNRKREASLAIKQSKERTEKIEGQLENVKRDLKNYSTMLNTNTERSDKYKKCDMGCLKDKYALLGNQLVTFQNILKESWFWERNVKSNAQEKIKNIGQEQDEIRFMLQERILSSLKVNRLLMDEKKNFSHIVDYKSYRQFLIDNNFIDSNEDIFPNTYQEFLSMRPEFDEDDRAFVSKRLTYRKVRGKLFSDEVKQLILGKNLDVSASNYEEFRKILVKNNVISANSFKEYKKFRSLDANFPKDEREFVRNLRKYLEIKINISESTKDEVLSKFGSYVTEYSNKHLDETPTYLGLVDKLVEDGVFPKGYLPSNYEVLRGLDSRYPKTENEFIQNLFKIDDSLFDIASKQTIVDEGVCLDSEKPESDFVSGNGVTNKIVDKVKKTYLGELGNDVMANDKEVKIHSSFKGKFVIGEKDTSFDFRKIDEGHILKWTLESQEGQEVIFDGDIVSDSVDNTVELKGKGRFIFNGVVDPVKVNVENGEVEFSNGLFDVVLESGNISFVTVKKDSYLSDAGNSVNFTSGGGTLNLINSEASIIKLKNLTLSDNSQVWLDVNLKKGEMDRFECESVTVNNNNKLNITKLNIISDVDSNQIEVAFSSNGDELEGNFAYAGDFEVAGPVNVYGVSNDGTDVIFKRLRSASSALMTPVASLVGSYLTQINGYDVALTNLNNQKGVWSSSYGGFGKVGLDGGPKVENASYGSMLGWNSDLLHVNKNWGLVGSLYGGYVGSHQTFDGVSTYQNGGLLGLASKLSNGAFYVSNAVSIGYHEVEGRTIRNTGDFSNFTFGIVVKSGYNFKLGDGQFNVQPNCLLSYSLVNSEDYTDSSNLSVNSKVLHGMQITPGLKVDGKFNYGIKAFAHAKMVFNVVDKTRVKVDNVKLDRLSIKPYVRYGFGLEKSFSKCCVLHGSVDFINGGINGINAQLGVSYLFK